MALIEKTGTGEWKLKGLDWRELNEIPEQARQAVYGALCKLKDYEESGMEPDQVVGMKEMCEQFLDGKI